MEMWGLMEMSCYIEDMCWLIEKEIWWLMKMCRLNEMRWLTEMRLLMEKEMWWLMEMWGLIEM